MVTLRNVIDIRTGNVYSVVKVKENKARYFTPVEPEPEEVEEEEEEE